jgi:hypothetical protein
VVLRWRWNSVSLEEGFGGEFGEVLGLVVAAGDDLEGLKARNLGLEVLGCFGAATEDGL